MEYAHQHHTDALQTFSIFSTPSSGGLGRNGEGEHADSSLTQMNSFSVEHGQAAPVGALHSSDGAPAVDAAQSCDAVLFVYFLDDERARFALSRDSFHFSTLNGGAPIPQLRPPKNTSVRDPFVNRAPNGMYHLVATNDVHVGGVHPPPAVRRPRTHDSSPLANAARGHQACPAPNIPPWNRGVLVHSWLFCVL